MTVATRTYEDGRTREILKIELPSGRGFWAITIDWKDTAGRTCWKTLEFNSLAEATYWLNEVL